MLVICIIINPLPLLIIIIPKTLSTAVQQKSACMVFTIPVSAGNQPLSSSENLTGHTLKNTEVADAYASSEHLSDFVVPKKQTGSRRHNL